MKHVLLYAVMLTFVLLALVMKNPWVKYPLLIITLGDYLVINYIWLTSRHE
jgi:hypothetical protein